MEDHVLNEDFFYEAADVQNKSIPIEEIKYVGISVQPFTDISFILKASNLEIVTLRLCSLNEFPQEFFSLPKLKSIDLSGNAIEVIPDKQSFSQLQNLRSVNLQDNNIVELSEIFKINGAPNIRQLILTGNVCLTQNDSFNLITKEFNKLIVLNDLIITSQHRAFINDLAVFDNNSCLSTSKIDDFFFHYVRYMHASSNERYVRRSNAEYFCLNRIIRKYSAAEKIQSVFRGYITKNKYEKMVNAALNLRSFLKLWYFKRLTAANRIRSSFLHFQTKQLIKCVQSIRKIQSSWRRKKAREYARIEVFQYKGSYGLLIPRNDHDKMKEFLKANNLAEPKSITITNFKLISTKPAKKVPLPGSPKIYYSCDDSLIVRKCHNNDIPKNATIWCSHDHSVLKGRKKVTQYGINYTRQCPFASIPMIKFIAPRKSPKQKQYDIFIRLNYYDRSKFAEIINSFMNSDTGLTIYPERNIVLTAAKTTIQSSFRTFIERLNNFRDIKQKAIEARALSCIRYNFKTIKIHRCVSHISRTIKYYNSLPHSTTFYIPYQYLSLLIAMKKQYDVDFGFASDKTLVLDKKSPDGFLKKIIPTGRIIFALNDLPSIVNTGVLSSKAQSSMFSIPIPMKLVNRYKIMRLTYINHEEARRRLTLFAWMTNKFNVLMTERDVLEFCSANVLHSCWRGYTSRRRLVHILVQMGSNFDHSKLFKKFNYKGNDREHYRKLSLLEDMKSNNKGPLSSIPLSTDAIESIHELRHDYRPWETHLKDYREIIHNESKYKTDQPQNKQKSTNSANNDTDDEDKEISQSALNVGLLKNTNDFPEVEVKTIKIPSKSALNYNRNNNIVVNANPGRYSNIENTKANNLLLSNSVKSGVKDKISNGIINMDKDQTTLAVPPFEEGVKVIEVEEKNDDDDDEDNFNADFDFLKNKKRLSNNYKFLSSNVKKEKLKFTLTHSQLNLPVTFKSLNQINKIGDENNLKSIKYENNNKTQSQIVDNPLLSTFENEMEDNPRLMAPFFTGSPKRKVRSQKEDGSDDEFVNEENRSIPFLKGSKFKSSKSTFLLFENAFDIEPLIKEETDEKKEQSSADDNDITKKRAEQSSQKSKNLLQELVKVAFTKLSRLHHLGLIIVSNAAVDNSIEKNRQIAIEAREDLEKKRAENDMKKITLSNETHQRSQIEHSLLLEAISDQRTTAQREKAKKVKELKEEQRMKREKYIQSRNFGQNFVNVARTISHKTEMSKKGFYMKNSLIKTQNNNAHSASFSKSNSVLSNSISCGNRKQQMIQQKAVSSLRETNKENRSALKEFNNELEQQKRRLTLLDKINLEKKRSKNKDSKTEKLNAIYENKRKDKERRKLLKSQKNAFFVPSPPVPQVQEDQIENAVRNIGNYMGANLGIVESQILIDIINNIVK